MLQTTIMVTRRNSHVLNVARLDILLTSVVKSLTTEDLVIAAKRIKFLRNL